jgi:hypothetical protein
LRALLGELGKLAQAELGVAGEVVLQPAEVSGTVVACEFVLAGQVVGVALRNAVVADVAFDRDLRGMEVLMGRDDLRDLGLALGREHIVGLHVEDVMSWVGHVLDAEYQHLAAGGRSGLLRRRLLRDGGKYGAECQHE